MGNLGGQWRLDDGGRFFLLATPPSWIGGCWRWIWACCSGGRRCSFQPSFCRLPGTPSRFGILVVWSQVSALFRRHLPGLVLILSLLGGGLIVALFGLILLVNVFDQHPLVVFARGIVRLDVAGIPIVSVGYSVLCAGLYSALSRCVAPAGSVVASDGAPSAGAGATLAAGGVVGLVVGQPYRRGYGPIHRRQSAQADFLRLLH